MNSLALETQKSPFTTTTFKEFIDWKMLIKMIYSEDILRTVQIKNKFGETFSYENERNQIIAILKEGCKHSLYRKKLDTDLNKLLPMLYHHTEKYMSSDLQVKYYYDKKKEIGRVYPCKSLSLCNLRRGLRHHLALDNYIDIDVVNCHFKIADEIFNKDEIKFPILHDYVINRNHYLKELGDHFKSEGYCGGLDYQKPDDYDSLKECFLRKLYYGTYESWRNELGLPPFEAPEFIKKLETEFDGIAEIIKTNNPKWLEMVNTKTFNVNGTIVSWFLQEHERRVLEKLFEFLHKTKQIKHNNCVLCFDGIMIRINEKNKDENYVKKLLKDATAYIVKEIGICVEFKAKAFDVLEYTDKLNSIEIEYVDDPTILIDDKDDNEASNIIYEQFVKDKLIYCRDQFYLKIDNVWTTNEKVINGYLKDIILESGIKTTTAKGDIKCYAQHASNAKNILDIVKGKAAMNPKDDWYYKFHDTTTGKICFEDGVLYLESKEWRDWSEIEENTIFSTIKINRQFKPYFEATMKADKSPFDLNTIMKTIEDTLFNGIMGSQSNQMLHFLSRAIGGYYQDKDWGVWIGSRNCGKGCINTLLTSAFGAYITSLPAPTLMCQRMRSTDTKEMSWLLDLQYPRLAIIQEIDRKEESVKVNGTTIKSICSGGDPQKSRRNFGEIMEFIIESKLLIMCNDFPKIEPADALETCIQFNSGKQFKTQSFIDDRTAELNEKLKGIADEEMKKSMLKELDTYLPADDSVKYMCKTLDWSNAFVMLLMNRFVNTKLEASHDNDLKEDTSDSNEFLNSKFIFTDNVKNTMSNKRLKEIHEVSSTGLSFQKYKNLLIARGCKEYRTGGERGLTNIKEISDDKMTNEKA
jgi:hypothetical protein